MKESPRPSVRRRAARVRHAPLTTSRRLAIRRALLRWYDGHRRDLPWRRREGDAYAQWVAEIMLQQTRVETVLAYYERFLKRFPDVAALARAAPQEVLKAWEGLGYYRRVLHLHRAAQQLHERAQEVPQTFDALRALPGIGDYTAAAIASIAGGEARAAVDGNVARVIARLCGVNDDVLSPAGRASVQCLADELLAPRRAGDFNQAWMDLGSGVCTPRGPDCARCPLAAQCVAVRDGLQDVLPLRGAGRRAPREVKLIAAVISCNGRVLVRQRPTGGLWSGLWELPSVELAEGVAPLGALRDLLAQEGVRVAGRAKRSARVTHALTHRLLTFDVYTGLSDGSGKVMSPARRWADADEREALPFSTAHRRILAAAL